MVDNGFYLIMRDETLPLNEEDIQNICSEVVSLYEDMYNEILDLEEASGFSRSISTRMVRKRYKDFTIN